MKSDENSDRSRILEFVIDERPAYGFPKPRKYRGAAPKYLTQAERDLDVFAQKVRDKPVDQLRVSLKSGGFKRPPKPRPGAKFNSKRWHFERRLKKYGLTVDSYGAMLVAQEHKCLLCSMLITEARDVVPARKGRPGFVFVTAAHSIAIDHCHATGKVRGLLCMRCNRGLGDFADDPERMRRAADYVERNR